MLLAVVFATKIEQNVEEEALHEYANKELFNRTEKKEIFTLQIGFCLVIGAMLFNLTITQCCR
jgi:hypothetical protein